MQAKHVPRLEPRYWAALCVASVFGANMGDYFAKVLGLGHIKGLPILAGLLLLILLIERRDTRPHQAYYWLSIVVVRTAATNLADFLAGDLKLTRLWIMLALAVLLAAIVAYAKFRAAAAAPAEGQRDAGGVLTADAYFWLAMLTAGTLGTVAGDFSSFGTGLGLVNATIALSALLCAWFFLGKGLLRILPFYWFTVVLVRTAGTTAGDFAAGRTLGLGLPLSTLCTGMLLVLLLALWQPRAGEQPD
jgi:uncharacterized membrane-anchored protein